MAEEFKGLSQEQIDKIDQYKASAAEIYKSYSDINAELTKAVGAQDKLGIGQFRSVNITKDIAKLQKERSKLEKTGESLKQNEKKKLAEADKLEAINEKIQRKLENYQELYDSNQRLIYLGRKVNDLSEKYFNNKRKRELMTELFKLVQIENSKRKKVSVKENRKQKAQSTQIKKEVEKKENVIRKKKKAAKKKEIETPKQKPTLKVGDRVRLEDGRAVGSIDKIEKNKATVNYGLFRTNVSVEQLELVETKK